MKKRLIIIVPIILAIILCISLVLIKPSSKEIKPNEGLIIEYSTRPAFGTEEAMNNHYFIKLYSDKTLSYGYTKDNNEKKVTISENDYNKIVDLAYSDDFQSLDEDISDPMIADGARLDIKVYNSDNTVFKTGGLNPNNQLFNKLVIMLREQVK